MLLIFKKNLTAISHLYTKWSKWLTLNYHTYYYLPNTRNDRERECICVSGARCITGDCYLEDTHIEDTHFKQNKIKQNKI